MRYLSTFAIGEKVRYYTDTGGSWMDRITAHTDIATVVSKSSNGVDVCLGWKAGERFLLGADQASNPNQGWTTSVGTFDRIIWLSGARCAEEVGGNVVSPTADTIPAPSKMQGPDGLTCSGGCGNFFPMAVANRPDGTLWCYSCRNR
jgi:hypothetical protein